jgi:hypothetical protein
VLVEKHANKQGQRVAAEQLVGRRVLGQLEGRHAGDPAPPDT